MREKSSICIFILLLVAQFGKGQRNFLDSVKSAIQNTRNDSLKLKGYTALLTFYSQTQQDSALFYGDKLLNLSRILNIPLSQCYALSYMGFAFQEENKYIESLTTYNEALVIAEDPQSEKNVLPYQYTMGEEFYDHPQTPGMHRIELLANLKSISAILYHRVSDFDKEYQLIKEVRSLCGICDNNRILSTTNLLAGIMFKDRNLPDSALNALHIANMLALKAGYLNFLGSIALNMGLIYVQGKDTAEAIKFYRSALAYSKLNYPRGVLAADEFFSKLFLLSGKKDSCLFYAQDARAVAERIKAPDLELRAFQRLAAYYNKEKIKDSIIKYQQLIIQYNEEIKKLQRTPQFGIIEFKEQKRLQEIEAAQKEYRTRLQTYGYITGLIAFLVIALLLWRNNKNIQLANKSLKIQKEETEQQKAKVEQMFSQLQSTQAQLIQSEKMASLGELTAGIAHEIQNPLNFVNNFSEVNEELVHEMKNEIRIGQSDKALDLAENIRQNMEKITQHGKRADGIVKSMLQHSRVSTTQKEASDINAMAEEALRLSYLGMRAKDGTFNCELKTNLDKSIGKVNVIPEDLRRVLINMFNNSFYSIQQKIRSGEPGFKPELILSTSKSKDQVEIKVRDNGIGISKKNMDKIFQPFFTTKPTGQGTGLGLSLSYDIIVNEHGGELVVQSEEGNFAEFIIRLI